MVAFVNGFIFTSLLIVVTYYVLFLINQKKNISYDVFINTDMEDKNMLNIIKTTFKLFFTYLAALFLYIKLDTRVDMILVYLLFIFPLIMELFDKLELNKKNTLLFYAYLTTIIINSLSFVLGVTALVYSSLVLHFHNFIVFGIVFNVFVLLVELGISIYKIRKEEE